MAAVIFIGDELSAAGFRLTGIETVVPDPSAARAAMQEARGRAALVLITAELAQHIPRSELETAMLAESPVLAVVPDVLFRANPPDLARRLRIALGIET